ncbi:hypothetical protein [Streptosporangium longisporum]|uniref:Uncharacterized protein n=1 Tax=Streptosporangium longisporum TaxID=46187 RepID=A0ABN3YE54_9ACTN
MAKHTRLDVKASVPESATDRHYIVYPWVADCAALCKADWKPLWTNEAAFEQLLQLREKRTTVAGRRLPVKEARSAAAGATAAVIGTAAIVRQVRKETASAKAGEDSASGLPPWT